MSENERKEIAEVVQALGALDDGAKQFVLGYAVGVAATMQDKEAS